MDNREKKVVQAGFWLRKLHSIFLLKSKNFQKCFIRKDNVNLDNLMKTELKNSDFNDLITEEAIRSTKILNFLTNDDYDRLLAENIVFLDLYDASANNSIIECMVRNTPVLVNPIESVVEYLGPKYPFYFHDLDEAAAKLEDQELIRETHHYLVNHPVTKKLTGEYFKKSVLRSSIYRSL